MKTREDTANDKTTPCVSSCCILSCFFHIQKRPRMMKKGLWKGLFVLYLLIIILTVLIFKFEPSLTGAVVYEERNGQHNWTFSNSSEYTYNSSAVSVATGNVSLVPTIIITRWNTTTEQQSVLNFALYKPLDKTSTLSASGGQELELDSGQILDLFFPAALSNGDILSLYLTEGEATTIYLCEKGTVCSAPGFGQVQYDGQSGWYNITVSGMVDSASVLNLLHSN